MKDSTKQLRTPSLVAYASLEFPFTILTAPVLAVLPPLYAKEYGLDLAVLGTILLVLRITDAITDPLVGVLSDRTKSRFGPRKPWIMVGSILSLWCAYNLFKPPGDVSAFYVGVWLCGLYIGWTMLEVPYRAWSGEIATTYKDRSKLSLMVRFVGNGALLVFGFLPLMFSPTNEFDFAVLSSTANFLLVLLPLGTLWALYSAPVGQVDRTKSSVAVNVLWECIKHNKSLQIWLLALTVGYLGVGIAGALFFVLFDSYLGIGSHFTLISTTSQVTAMCSIPFWGWLIGKYEKRTVMVIGLAGIACTLPILHFIEPGDYALPMYMVNDALWYTFLVGFEVAILAMVGDIADEELARSGQVRAGLFCALWSFSRKGMYALGAFIAYGITGMMGYEAGSETNSDLAILSLQTVNGGLPAFICFCAAVIAFTYPLSRSKYENIKVKLKQRSGNLRSDV